jgi:WD40 repeat protein
MGPATSVAFSPDGKTLVSGSRSVQGKTGEVKLWDAITGQFRATLKGNVGQVSTVAFSRNGKLLAAANHKGTETLWDMPAKP